MGYPKALFFTYPDNPSNTKSMATLLAYAGGVGCPLRAPAPTNPWVFLAKLAEVAPPPDNPATYPRHI